MWKIMTAMMVAACCVAGESWADRTKYPRYTPRTPLPPRTSVYVPPPRLYPYDYGYVSPFYGYGPGYGAYWHRPYGYAYRRSVQPYWLPATPPERYAPEQGDFYGAERYGAERHGGETDRGNGNGNGNGAWILDADGYWVPRW